MVKHVIVSIPGILSNPIEGDSYGIERQNGYLLVRVFRPGSTVTIIPGDGPVVIKETFSIEEGGQDAPRIA